MTNKTNHQLTFVPSADLVSRRFLLQAAATAFGASMLGQSMTFASSEVANFKGKELFARIISLAHQEHWEQLPIGDLMGKIANELKGTPYVANTLELSADKEFCSVNFEGLDCVTFFETTLDLARIIKKGLSTPADLLREVQFTRYRNGELSDYTSRLHYTTDWFVDNRKKKVIRMLDNLPGAIPFTQKVGVMSAHADNSLQLKAHPEFTSVIREQEKAINDYKLNYVPMGKLENVEHLLQTGDIVGVCTSASGIDITHTGLIYCDERGVRHFMDASSKKAAMRVQIESGPISRSLNWSRSLTGVMFARPLEPQ